MLYFLSTLLILLNAAWLMLVFFGLPGNWLILISTCLFAWWRAEDSVFSLYTLIVIAALTVLGELAEFFAGMGSARKAGASWRGSLGTLLGAIAGAILGTFLIPILFFGTILGACIGAGIGAWSFELFAKRKPKDYARIAFGASLGQFLGIAAKFIVGVLIWLIVAVAAFWP